MALSFFMVNSSNRSCPNCGGPLYMAIQNDVISMGCKHCKVIVFTSREDLIRESQEKYGASDFAALMDILHAKYIKGLERVIKRREAFGEIIKSELS